MFGLFSRSKAVSAQVNGTVITVQPKETLLQAALRQGIDFPHSCRVGGCATCKCQLTSGRVRQLTDAGYVLSDDELDRGFILACQSVPRTDVCIQVDLARGPACRAVPGRVIRHEQLTHDISHLRIQLDEPLPHRAGQHAQLSLDSLPGVSRSYSFASRPQADSIVNFFVRGVPGGVFTSQVQGRSLVGQTVVVDGPHGDFFLRPAQAPLLLMAGGSGLAPLLAMLEEALAEGVCRPVVLMFGARTRADLYALDAIEHLRGQWPARFDFLPILSAEPPGSTWTGLRGLVTELVATHAPTGCHAYLCGPPAMVDAAASLLLKQGVDPAHVHADRFITRGDVAAAA